MEIERIGTERIRGRGGGGNEAERKKARERRTGEKTKNLA